MTEAFSRLTADDFVGRAERGCLSRITIYVHRDALDVRNRDGCTALRQAILKRHGRVAFMLLRAGASVDAHSCGSSLLDLMLEKGTGGGEMLRALIAAGADVASGNIFMKIVCSANKRNWLELLQAVVPLPQHVYGGELDGKLQCVRVHTRPTRSGARPSCAHLFVCKCLGAKPLDAYTPPLPPPPPPPTPAELFMLDVQYLTSGTTSPSSSLVATYEAQGVDVAHVRSSDNETTALHWAVWHNDEDLVAELLLRGADPNARHTLTGGTPLLWAARKSSPEIIQRLLDAGGDACASNKYGLLPAVLLVDRGFW